MFLYLITSGISSGLWKQSKESSNKRLKNIKHRVCDAELIKTYWTLYKNWLHFLERKCKGNLQSLSLGSVGYQWLLFFLSLSLFFFFLLVGVSDFSTMSLHLTYVGRKAIWLKLEGNKTSKQIWFNTICYKLSNEII